MANTTIVKDSRPLLSVYNIDGETGATVGYGGVTFIEAYEELGQMSPVTWFKVWKGDFLYQRLNGAHMTEVYYKEG